MTPSEAIEGLKAAQAEGDTEQAHSDADIILCNLLIELGHLDVVTEWRKVRKWYA